MVFANLPRDTMHKGYMLLSIAKGGHSVPSVQCSPLRVLHSLLRRRLCVHGYYTVPLYTIHGHFTLSFPIVHWFIPWHRPQHGYYLGY